MFTVLAASALLLTASPTNTQGAASSNIEKHDAVSTQTFYSHPEYQSDPTINFNEASQVIEQVSTSGASAMSGTFTFNFNTNVRLDAGTQNRVVTVASKGARATATHQKRNGNQTWYRVTTGSSTGWVLSTLLSPVAQAQAASTTSAVTTANLGSFRINFNSNIRANAGTNHAILTMAQAGTTVTATASAQVGKITWYRVTANGRTGWISGTLVSPVAAASTAPAVSTVSAVAPTAPAVTSASGTYRTNFNSNMRANAGTSHGIVGLAPAGSTLTATASAKVGNITWYRVTHNGTTGWISGTLLTQTTGVAQASSNVNTSSVVSTAMGLLGTPYRFGGTTTSGFDCSGFIQYVFGQNGKSVTRTTLTQFAESVTVSTPQVGDLVFFANTYRPGISHVGIYIGNNQFVHSGGRSAEFVSLNNSYWGPKFHSFKRFR